MPRDVSTSLDMTEGQNARRDSQLRQIIRQHVAPIVPIVSAPFPIIEPVLNLFGVEDLGQAIRLVSGVVPFTRADDDAHVIVFPWVGYVRQIFIWRSEERRVGKAGRSW